MPLSRRLGLLILILLPAWLLPGCATLSRSFEPPTLQIVNLRLLPATGLEQPFEVVLRVTNPNSLALRLKGMSYRLEVGGQALLSGATAEVPEIGPYASAELTLPVTASLISSLRLVRKLMQSDGGQNLDYRLEATLDPVARWLPPIRVVEEGALPLIAK